MREEREDYRSGMAGIPYFLTGILVGAVTGLLLAPRAGGEMREDIGDWVRDKGQRARGVATRLRDRIPHRAREAVEEARGRAESALRGEDDRRL